MKQYRAALAFCAIAVFAAVAGCASKFSHEALDRVDRGIPFMQLQANPDAFRGKWVMEGGYIIETRNAHDGTYIEVLETPLDRQGRPLDTDQTGGRFIISSKQFLDPAVYHPGKPVSVIGEVSGQEVRLLGEVKYRYPVLTPQELHVWEPRSSPQVSFGFGIGVFHGF